MTDKFIGKSLDERIEIFLDTDLPSMKGDIIHVKRALLENDLPRLREDITSLNTKMWLVLALLIGIFVAIISPLIHFT